MEIIFEKSIYSNLNMKMHLDYVIGRPDSIFSVLGRAYECKIWFLYRFFTASRTIVDDKRRQGRSLEIEFPMWPYKSWRRYQCKTLGTCFEISYLVVIRFRNLVQNLTSFNLQHMSSNFKYVYVRRSLHKTIFFYFLEIFVNNRNAECYSLQLSRKMGIRNSSSFTCRCSRCL